MRWIAPLGCAASLSGLLQAPLRAEPSANDMALIQKFCLATFNTAFANAGKTPPAGMGDFTCQCLGRRIQAGDSLGTARETCTMEASRRFPVPKG